MTESVECACLSGKCACRSGRYVHQELNREMTAIGGHYLLIKEVRLPFRGREVLYLLGHAAFDTMCCGAGGCAYALVPGFILQWKSQVNAEGQAVSRVQPIDDRDMQDRVRRLIQSREAVHAGGPVRADGPVQAGGPVLQVQFL